jgi:hypothetical protein
MTTAVIVSTPLEDHLSKYGLLVKREDLCCPHPGPPFSKMRGVIAHVASRPEEVIGVLDTAHSQAGWAVAYACSLLDKECINFYPVYKGKEFEPLQRQQQMARTLGARLVDLPAARSAILFHRAKKHLTRATNKPSYMMPNALKLDETVAETAEEFRRTFEAHGKLIGDKPILVPASSGTIAAGVDRGLNNLGLANLIIVHMGYSRSAGAMASYIHKMSKAGDLAIRFIDEGYQYKDEAYYGPTPPWPCDKFYDLKAFRWWMAKGRQELGEAVLWNIG